MNTKKEYAVKILADYLFEHIVADSYDEAKKIAMDKLKISPTDEGSPYIIDEMYSEKELCTVEDALKIIKEGLKLPYHDKSRTELKISYGFDKNNNSIHIFESFRRIKDGFIYDLDFKTVGGLLFEISQAFVTVSNVVSEDIVVDEKYDYNMFNKSYNDMDDVPKMIRDIVSDVSDKVEQHITSMPFKEVYLGV